MFKYCVRQNSTFFSPKIGKFLIHFFKLFIFSPLNQNATFNYINYLYYLISIFKFYYTTIFHLTIVTASLLLQFYNVLSATLPYHFFLKLIIFLCLDFFVKSNSQFGDIHCLSKDIQI